MNYILRENSLPCIIYLHICTITPQCMTLQPMYIIARDIVQHLNVILILNEYSSVSKENIGFNKNQMNSVVVKCSTLQNIMKNVLTSLGDNTLALYVPNPKDFYEHNN